MDIGLFIDIGIAVIGILVVIIGLARGFSKAFTKGVCRFFALLASIVATYLLFGFLAKQAFYAQAVQLINGWMASVEWLQAPVTTLEELQAVMASQPFLAILAPFAENIFTMMSQMGATSLGLWISTIALNVVGLFVMWLVFYIAIKYILYGIKALLKKISKVPVFNTLDRIFGLIWTVLLAYLIVVGLILTIGEVVIIQFVEPNMPGFIAEKLTPIYQSSKLLSFLHNTNVLGAAISSMIGIDLTVILPITQAPAEVAPQALALLANR